MRHSCVAISSLRLSNIVILATLNCLALAAPKQHVFEPNDLAAIPSFMIIGAAKGGTTDLYHQLTTVAIPGADPDRPDPPIVSDHKEIRFLHHSMSEEDLLLGPNTAAGRYLELIAHPCAPRNASFIPAAVRACMAKQPQTYTIDASPIYLSSPFTPLQLRALSTNTKVILMLRDPTDTVESFFNHRQAQEGSWKEYTLGQLLNSFFEFAAHPLNAGPAFSRLATCDGGLRCMEEGYRDLVAAGLLKTKELQLFANSMYDYALAAWRRHYFRPGRVMVIDSHAYFVNRTAIMEQVIHFLYNRSMTPAEVSLSATAAAMNAKRLPPSPAAPGVVMLAEVQPSAEIATDQHASRPSWMLPRRQRRTLEEFFEIHVLKRMYDMLQDMSEEGAWVLGFYGHPWPWARWA